MRRLTLILSDLYLPAESAREALPDTVSLPSLAWLLRFSESRRIDDWRRWLAQESGVGELARMNPASAVAASLGAKGSGAWLATPVCLEARLDHVRLRDRGLLRLPPDQRETLMSDFAKTFGPAMSLHECGERGFLLEGGPVSSTVTVDPARLLDADVGSSLPAAGAAGELRRLAAEMEMWLHSAPVNEARERAGQRRITSLWLWGGGADSVAGAWNPVTNLHGRDPWLLALAGHASNDGELASEPPASFADTSTDTPVIVELAPMSGAAQESLGALEKNWFEPIRSAISSGALQSFTLVANDRAFFVGARAGWRFWRARRGWLAALAKA